MHTNNLTGQLTASNPSEQEYLNDLMMIPCQGCNVKFKEEDLIEYQGYRLCSECVNEWNEND